MVSEKSRVALAAINHACLIGVFINSNLRTLDLEGIADEPAVKIRKICKDTGDAAVKHSLAARSEINTLSELAESEYPKQPTKAAVRFFCLLTKAAQGKRFGEIKQALKNVADQCADEFATTAKEISEMAVVHFGLDQAEADRLNNQALAMAGLKGQPVNMLVSM